jgi:hypothetical protein
MTMKIAAVLLLGLAAVSAIELTPANWDSETAGEFFGLILWRAGDDIHRSSE